LEIWYSYGEIQFYRRHIQFVCDHAVTFRNGQWPRAASGYTQALARRGPPRAEAPFVKPALVWAEVETRLARCERVRSRPINRHVITRRFDLDGELAIGYYLGDFAMDWLVRREQCPEANIRRRISRAVAYAGSGPCRRWEACDACRDTEACTRKKRPGVTYDDWVRLSHYRWR
jgi:hypothetical protein